MSPNNDSERQMPSLPNLTRLSQHPIHGIRQHYHPTDLLQLGLSILQPNRPSQRHTPRPHLRNNPRLRPRPRRTRQPRLCRSFPEPSMDPRDSHLPQRDRRGPIRHSIPVDPIPPDQPRHRVCRRMFKLLQRRPGRGPGSADKLRRRTRHTGSVYRHHAGSLLPAQLAVCHQSDLVLR